MPFVYTSSLGLGTLATSATINTSTDHARLVAGLWLAASQARTVNVQAAYTHGRSAAVTQLAGITYALQRWTTTASTGGTVITASVADQSVPVATANAQYAASGASLTVGTGGPTLLKTWGSGVTGPGSWVAPNPDSYLSIVANNTTNSIDLWSQAGTASLLFGFSIEHQE